jgi:hypothetical protein
MAIAQNRGQLGPLDALCKQKWRLGFGMLYQAALKPHGFKRWSNFLLQVSWQLSRSGGVLTLCRTLDAALKGRLERSVVKCGGCTLQGCLSGHGDL